MSGWPAWIWLIAALGLAGAEALTGDMFLLMLSGGALAAAGSHVLFGELLIDGIVFAVVSVLLLVLVRPVLRRRFAAGLGLPEPVKALEGKSAMVLDKVGRHEGQVKLDGEVWTARPLNDDDVYEPGEHVTVVRIDGATAVVFKGV
jgi:membrane protein implicated in regulation of membrane protease activity